MTQKNDIFLFLERSFQMTSNIDQIQNALQFPRSSIRRILGQETLKKNLTRVSVGTYKIELIYYKISQTKTSHYKNKRTTEPFKLNAVIIGWIKSTKINMKNKTIDTDVKNNLNEQFKKIIIDAVDNSDFTGMPFKIKIEGMEILENDHDFVMSSYDRDWKVDTITIETRYGDYEIKENDYEVINEKELY